MEKKSNQNIIRLYKENYPILILIYAVVIFNAFISATTAFESQKVVDMISGGESKPFIKSLIVLSLLFLVNVIMKFVFNRLNNKYNCYIGITIRNNLFKNIINKRYPDFKQKDIGEYVSMLTVDSNKLQDGYFLSKINIFNGIVNIASSIGVMIFMSWKLSLIVLVLSVIPMAVSSFMGRNLSKINEKIIEYNRIFTSYIKEVFNGFPLMKNFMVEEKLFSRFKKVNHDWNKSSENGGNEIAKMIVFSEGISQFITIGTIGVGSLMIFAGMLSFGVIMAFFELIGNVLGPVQTLTQNICIRNGVKPIVLKLLEETESIYDSSRSQKIEDFNDNIKFENVSFSYNKENPHLEGVYFEIKKNRKYMLAGGSGGGKSTIFDLIRGYYSDYEGSGTIDGIEIKNIDLYSLNKLISTVDQNVFLYNATIRENITLFSDYPDDQIMQAAKMAGLYEFVEKNGLDYSCGENGNLISGGEKQRISIARCILRNTPILFFDEATSALDNEIASDIENLILGLDKTCFVISHRFNTNVLKKYDKIFFVEKGSISEQGTYDDLMLYEGKFYSQVCTNLDVTENITDENKCVP